MRQFVGIDLGKEPVPPCVMKRQFDFTKVRYRGLEKNAQCAFTKCALVNLALAKKALLAV